MLKGALRLDRGGWATALISGGITSLLTFWVGFGAFPSTIIGAGFVALIGSCYAGIFWLSLRIQAPYAFQK